MFPPHTDNVETNHVLRLSTAQTWAAESDLLLKCHHWVWRTEHQYIRYFEATYLPYTLTHTKRRRRRRKKCCNKSGMTLLTDSTRIPVVFTILGIQLAHPLHQQLSNSNSQLSLRLEYQYRPRWVQPDGPDPDASFPQFGTTILEIIAILVKWHFSQTQKVTGVHVKQSAIYRIFSLKKRHFSDGYWYFQGWHLWGSSKTNITFHLIYYRYVNVGL